MRSYQRELDVAEAAARRAGAAVLRLYDTRVVKQMKGPGDSLTEADLAANRIIQTEIEDAFAHDGWLSEETCDDLMRTVKRRIWIVDPLDGTREFVAAIPEFAVSIALAVEGEAVAAAVFNPVSDEMFLALRGGGAFRNGVRIAVSTRRELHGAILLASRTEHGRGLFSPYEASLDVRPMGGQAYKLALLAAGDAEATFSHVRKSEWDIAGGALLVEEAGGVITDGLGEPIVFNQKVVARRGVVAASAHLYSEVLRFYRQHGGPQPV